MSDSPDYQSYTLRELYDVRNTIDRDAYPERAALVDAEIVTRESKRDPVAEEALLEEKDLQFVESMRFVISGAQILGGLGFLVSSALSYESLTTTDLVSAGSLAAFNIGAGVMLLKRMVIGVLMSLVNQALQFFSFRFTGVLYDYISPIHLGLSFDFAERFEYKFGIEISTNFRFLLTDGDLPTAGFAVNILTIVFFVLLLKYWQRTTVD